MFGCVYATEGSSDATLLDVARDFSPRVESCGDREVILDLHGLERLIGDAGTIAAELRRTAGDRGLTVRVAVAGTKAAARLLVHSAHDVTVVNPGDEPQALAALPIDLLAVLDSPKTSTNDPLDLIRTFKRWGIRTLGDLAHLPDDDLAARLGRRGVEWQRLARGEDARPLVPSVPEERFEQALDLEWPIDSLEPLAFVLGRLMEPLSAHLERRDRGAAVLHVRLHLIKTDGLTREVHARSLQLPAPIRDARTLRTLALLDLESNPPSAAVDRVVVAVDPTPGRVLQFSLLTRPLPSPEQVSTLMARLAALMGEGRCGSPVAVDAWQPGVFRIKPFAPSEAVSSGRSAMGTPPRHRDTEEQTRQTGLGASVPRWLTKMNDAQNVPAVALRRFRFPVPARVRVEAGKPARVLTDRRGLSGGCVQVCAGPWRTSGAWWEAHHWDRNEWDVTLTDGATYRLFHERDTGHWFIEGIVD